MKNIITKISVATLSLTLLLTSCGSANKTVSKIATNKTIVVGTSASYAPWCYQDDNGKETGYEIDVWNEIGKREGYTIKFSPSTYQALFGMIDAGQADTAAMQIAYDPTIAEKYSFSVPYAYSPMVFTIKNSSTVNTNNDLKGKKVGVTLGSNGQNVLEAFNKKYNLGIDIVTYDGTGLAIAQDVINGRLFATFGGITTSEYNIKKNNLPLKTYNEGYYEETNEYPFSKKAAGSDARLSDVNAALTAMRTDGTLKKLSNKWFGIDVTNSFMTKSDTTNSAAVTSSKAS